MSFNSIEVSAPTRVDLAGGTIDIPPIYLFHQPAYTGNLAVELRAKVSLSPLSSGVHLFRQDSKKELRVDSFKDLSRIRYPAMELLLQAVRQYGFDGMRLKSTMEAPARAGIGGSSALSVCLITALAHARQESLTPEQTILRAMAVETQTLKVPTGFQDYFTAYFGGLNVLQFTPDGVVRQTYYDPDFLQELENLLVLIYTGKPHFSGANNWALFRKHVEGDKKTIAFFERLKENAIGLQEAVLKKDIVQLAWWMRKDWETRRKMLPEMSTPIIDKSVDIARRSGSIAERVCGAGGGGFLAVLCPAEHQKQLLKNLSFPGLSIFKPAVAKQGVKISITG